MTTIEVAHAGVLADRSGPPAVGPTVPRGRVLGVVGARGGAGASTLAAAVARRLAQATATALVDADPGSPGLDVLVGLERDAGLRWPDLHGARGEVDGADLLALLPRWGRCAVLSADRTRPGPPPPEVVPDVLGALTSATGALVLDLGRAAVLAGAPTVAACDAVVLLVPRDLRAVAGGLALRESLDATGIDVHVVVRGPAPGGLGAAEVEQALGVTALCAVREDRRLAAHVERAHLPRSGPLGRAAAHVARLVAPGVRG